MPSVFIDELAGGRNLKHILRDPLLKDKVGKPQPVKQQELEAVQGNIDWQEEDFEDDDSDSDEAPVLTLQQKLELK